MGYLADVGESEASQEKNHEIQGQHIELLVKIGLRSSWKRKLAEISRADGQQDTSYLPAFQRQ
jgi:hypothetical protein